MCTTSAGHPPPQADHECHGLSQLTASQRPEPEAAVARRAPPIQSHRPTAAAAMASPAGEKSPKATQPPAEEQPPASAASPEVKREEAIKQSIAQLEYQRSLERLTEMPQNVVGDLPPVLPLKKRPTAPHRSDRPAQTAEPNASAPGLASSAASTSPPPGSEAREPLSVNVPPPALRPSPAEIKPAGLKRGRADSPPVNDERSPRTGAVNTFLQLLGQSPGPDGSAADDAPEEKKHRPAGLSSFSKNAWTPEEDNVRRLRTLIPSFFLLL